MSLSQFQGMFAPYEGKSVAEYEEMYSKRKQRKSAEQLMSSFGDRALTRADYMKLQQIDPSYVKEVLTNENAIRTALAPPALTPEQKAQLEIRKAVALQNVASSGDLREAQATQQALSMNPAEVGMTIPEELLKPEEKGAIASLWSGVLSLAGVEEEQKQAINPNDVTIADLQNHLQAKLQKDGEQVSLIKYKMKALQAKYKALQDTQTQIIKARGLSPTQKRKSMSVTEPRDQDPANTFQLPELR
jgi:hypothetical protein